jgi:hypothetical protein
MRLRYADEEECTAITRGAGFGSPVFQRLPIAWRTAEAGQIVDCFAKVSIRTRLIIDGQSPEVQQRIFAAIAAAAEARRADGVITLAWPAQLTVVQKP